MAAQTAAATLLKRVLYNKNSPILISRPPKLCQLLCITNFSTTKTKKSCKKKKEKSPNNNKRLGAEAVAKRRTRSEKEFEEDNVMKFGCHIPVMLGEVLEVFASLQLRSFLDCTLGAAGHSSAIMQAHGEMQLYIGMDIDPVAHDKARARINSILHTHSPDETPILEKHTLIENFKNVKSALCKVDNNLLLSGVDGILMDLGMSSMQVNDARRGFSVLHNGPLDMRMNPQGTLTAKDILNSWPDVEVGRILREYGEESNWRTLQNKIVKARLAGGLHSTSHLVDLIRSSTCKEKGGRQGWIKTATRVFQALRIAVNDELKTLEDSLYACFDCLAPGGRLAVISFHSLEDRIVKRSFLNIIRHHAVDKNENESEEDTYLKDTREHNCDDGDEREAWIRQKIQGKNAIILTKRPLTPSEKEEKMNCRSRSAKLRVIQKV